MAEKFPYFYLFLLEGRPSVELPKKGKPMFLSTGLSTWEEVDEAVEIILKHNNQLIIKHCIGIYPAPDKSWVA